MLDLRRIFVSLSLALLCCSAAFCQAVNGTIVGTVTDSTGAVIAGAKITLTEVNTKIVHTATTNASGDYSYPDLPPGTYDVSAEMSGFKRQVKTGTILEANNSPRVDLKLETGDVNQTIEVSASAATLQTERADTGRTMDAQLVEELPLGVNRNFQNLLDLVPGTQEETFQHSQFFNASSSLQTNTNGMPRMGNSYQIEGVDNNERTGLLQVLISPSEAISTVSVSTSNHDIELGRGTGAITNVMLKSGTNQFHGEAYWFDQNSAFDARSFFNPTVGHLAYNQTGGNIGGPVKHNKLFFFVNYVNTQDHEANTNQTNIPDALFRQGNFSEDPTHVIYDPATGDPFSGQNRVAFPGNIIPASRINPIAAKILATYLPPTNESFSPLTQTNDYFALLPAVKSNNQIDSDVDYAMTDKDRLRFRFSFGRPTTIQAPEFGNAGGPAQGAFEGTGIQKTYSAGIGYNRVISPTLLTEFRVGLSHYHNEATQTDYGKTDTAALGIPGVNVGGPFFSGFVGISIGGYSSPLFGYSASLPWDRAEANIDAVNTWTKIIRNHSIKWGVDMRRVRDDLLQDQTYSPRGVIYFGTGQTARQNVSATGTVSNSSTSIANDMASYLLDVPYQEGRDFSTYFPALRQWQIFSYVGDTWQATSRLTIDLGLRWEIYTAPTPPFAGGFSNYNPATNNLDIAGVGNVPMNEGFNTRFKYFSPRTGIAYRLDDKTVIRSGFGRSYVSFPDNTWMYNYPIRGNNLYAQPAGSTDTNGPVVLPGGALGSFEQGFPTPVTPPIPSNGHLPNPDPTTSQQYIPLNYKNPSILQWNFAVQRQLPWKLFLDVAYVGSHGVDIPAMVDLNAGQVLGATNNGGIGIEPMLLKYGITNAVTQYFQGFSTSYNSLQVKFDRRLSKGLTITTAVTWSKALNFQSGDDGGLDFYAGQGLQRNYARADYDREFTYVQSYVYKLPIGQGEKFMAHSVLGKIVGGWQLSGIFTGRSGRPMTFTGSNSLNLGRDGTATDNLVAPVQILHGINTGNPWFSINSFAKQNTATLTNQVQGTTGRNIISGPSLVSLNAGISRWIVLKPREGADIKMQLRLDSLNVTNTPQFSNPNTSSIGSAAFGLVTGTISSGTGVNGTGGGRVVTCVVKIF
ncbi:MAG TPA: carboxypeptidase regulatory-like domain-containing protein, partial [Bryobacteraceae bacterium]